LFIDAQTANIVCLTLRVFAGMQCNISGVLAFAGLFEAVAMFEAASTIRLVLFS